MSQMRSSLTSVVQSPALRRLVVVVLVVLAYHGWLNWQAIGKAAPGVGAESDEYGRFPVAVVLDFRPERFHILQLQQHGRVRGTDGTVVHLRSVSPEGVDALAELYWVAAIRPPQRE